MCLHPHSQEDMLKKLGRRGEMACPQGPYSQKGEFYQEDRVLRLSKELGASYTELATFGLNGYGCFSKMEWAEVKQDCGA